MAKTHPLVATLHVGRQRHLLGERDLDIEGRAGSGGWQSRFFLSLSLAGSGRVFRVGLSGGEGLSGGGVDSTTFALWWYPKRPCLWSEVDKQAARATFFDMAELSVDHLFPEQDGAEWTRQVPGAASGAASRKLGTPHGPEGSGSEGDEGAEEVAEAIAPLLGNEDGDKTEQDLRPEPLLETPRRRRGHCPRSRRRSRETSWRRC